MQVTLKALLLVPSYALISAINMAVIAGVLTIWLVYIQPCATRL